MKARNVMARIAVLCVCTSLASATTLRVPQDYPHVQYAVNAASSGDVIEITSNTYITDRGWAQIGTNNLTLRGVGPTRPLIDCRHAAMNSKGCYIIDGNNVTIENIEIKDCRLMTNEEGGNGSAVRLEGGSVTVRNCYIHDCDDGIMGGSNTSASVLVEYCEFNHCGSTPNLTSYGYTHNLYIGTMGTFTMQYCYSHGAAEGHEVKTRALNNYILYNLLSSEDGNGSRELQFAQGGTCYAIGNVIIQGPNSDNLEIVTYGGEGVNANPYLYVVNNTLINERAAGGTFLTMSNTATEAVFKNNIVQRLGSEAVVGGAYASKVTQTSNWITTNAYFRDPANHNYRLTTASTGALNTGSTPGTGHGYDLTPVYQYVFPYANQARPTNGTIDIGAYEYTPNAAPVVDVGPDQNVPEGQPINLHATASDFDCDPLSYTWTQPTGLNIVLTGTATADATFTAPTVSTVAQAAMTFTVTVSDGQGGITSDSVNVHVWMLGDINRDNSVDVTDLLTLVDAFGSIVGDSNYDSTCDFNSDGSVDVVDLLTLTENFGRTLN
jgi:hypothetical protein